MRKKYMNFSDWPFGVKIGVALVVLGVIPVAIISLVLTLNTNTELHSEAENELAGVVQSRKTTLELFLTDRRNTVHNLSHNTAVKDAIKDFDAALDADIERLGSEPRALENIRESYLGQGGIVNAYDNSAYTEAHAQHQPLFADFLHVFGFSDVFIINMHGDVLFNVDKEDDFGTNLNDGIYKDTNLATGYREIVAINTLHYTMVEDFAYYPPTGQAEAFILSPVFENNRMIAVIGIHLPIFEVNAIMNERTGLGDTGESYLVGSNGLMRNESRFIDDLGVETTILNPEVEVDTIAFHEAFKGNTGIDAIKNYRGNEVLSAWTLMEIQPDFVDDDTNVEGVRWALIAEIDDAEVNEPVVTARNTAFAATALAALAALGVAYALSGFLTRQVNELDNVFGDVRVGEFGSRAKIYGQDELGNIADGVNAMLDQMIGLLDETEQERLILETAVAKLAEEVSELATGDLSIQADVDEAAATSAVAQALNYAVSELRQLVLGVENTAAELTTASGDITDVVDVMVSQANNSALVAEQAASTAREGDQAVNQTIAAMGRIRTNTQETAQRIKRLGEVSQEISEFVRIIEEIADRTTVLALNASIQAAAAGDAGRGFAVVAEEVQRLAERSSGATREIEELVKNIQAETNQAVMSIEDSTQEVVTGSQLAQEAGTHMAQLNEQVLRLSELIQQTSETTAQQTANSVQMLANLSRNLQTSVSVFGLPQQVGQTNGNGNGDKAQLNEGVSADNLQPQLG